MEATESSCIRPEMLKSLDSSIGSFSVEKSLREILKSAFTTNCNLDDASISEEELQTLSELDVSEIIDNIKNLLEALLSFKSNCISSTSGELSVRCDQLEKMLQKQESDVRSHIKIEHQLKLHIDSLQQKLADAEQSLSEAKTSIKEMESRGSETIESKLKKIEAKFQQEINKLISEHKEDAFNEAKKNERIKKLEEMYERKEKAYIKLQADYTALKAKLGEVPEDHVKLIKHSSISDEKITWRRKSTDEDFNKVQDIGLILGKEINKKEQETKMFFAKDPVQLRPKFSEPIPPPTDPKSNGKTKSISSRRHIRSISDNIKLVPVKKPKSNKP